MIDPRDVTNYKMNDYEIQENALFWLLAAGKTASTVAKSLDNFLKDLEDNSGEYPFDKIRFIGKDELISKMKDSRFGCYNMRGEGIWQLSNSKLDLRSCSAEELEEIKGIGLKTSRCFIMHSRENARYAGLDTHILKYLSSRGEEVPEITPGSKKEYVRLENIFLKYSDESGKTPAEFDLEIWNEYSKR